MLNMTFAADKIVEGSQELDRKLEALTRLSSILHRAITSEYASDPDQALYEPSAGSLGTLHDHFRLCAYLVVKILTNRARTAFEISLLFLEQPHGQQGKQVSFRPVGRSRLCLSIAQTNLVWDYRDALVLDIVKKFPLIEERLDLLASCAPRQ